MTFEPRRRSCCVPRLRASRVLRNPRPTALRSSRPVEGASNKATAAPMASPASNHGIALLASDCQSRSSECAWFVMSGSCGFPGCLQASTRAPLIGVTRRLSFGAARTNFFCCWTPDVNRGCRFPVPDRNHRHLHRAPDQTLFREQRNHPAREDHHRKIFWQILWTGHSCFVSSHRSCLLSSEFSLWQLIRSSEASYQVRKAPLIECCLEQAQATTFYRGQTDGNRLFEVKFRVTAAGLERQGLSSATQFPQEPDKPHQN